MSTALKSARFLRRLTPGLVPVFSQLVELAPLIRVTEDLVSLVYFFEPYFRNCFVFCNIGMIFASQAPISFLYFRVARIFCYAEHVVVVFEFNGHNKFSAIRLNGTTLR